MNNMRGVYLRPLPRGKQTDYLRTDYLSGLFEEQAVKKFLQRFSPVWPLVDFAHGIRHPPALRLSI